MVLAAVREDGLRKQMVANFETHQAQWEVAIKEANKKINLLESSKSAMQTELDILRGQVQRYRESTASLQDQVDKKLNDFSENLSEIKGSLSTLKKNDKRLNEHLSDIERQINELQVAGIDRGDFSKATVPDFTKDMALLVEKILTVKSRCSATTKDLVIRVSTLDTAVAGLHQQLMCGLTLSTKAAVISSTLASQSGRPMGSLGLEFKASSTVAKQVRKSTEYSSDNNI